MWRVLFALLTSFLGCIRRLMEGSGLAELLETVYAPNAVVHTSNHMLTGKAVARATRAPFLLDEVLNAVFVANTFDIALPANVDNDAEAESQIENNKNKDMLRH